MPSNTRPESALAPFANALWPADRVGEALHLLAVRAGLPARELSDVPPAHARGEDLSTWLEAAALRAGVEAHRFSERLSDVPVVLPSAGPTLLRLGGYAGTPFLAIIGGSSRRLRAVGPDGRVHVVPMSEVAAALADPIDADGTFQHVLDRMQLSGRARARAHAALVQSQTGMKRFRDAWTLRLSPSATIPRQLGELGIARKTAALLGTYVAQSLLFVASWWLLGRAILQGTLDRGWILGWLLLLLSLVPLRLLVTWTQGTAALAMGIAIRRRLLRGALRMDRETIAQKGPGELFGTVLEAASIESLATSGGVLALLSILDLSLATLVLWTGGLSGPLLLVTWIVVLGALSVRYVRRRGIWTRERFAMTSRLLAAMVGHRTRVVQQGAADHHRAEDESLERYIRESRTMDASSLWLMAAPRGWLIVALAAMTPWFVQGAPPSQLALAVGGLLLAYRALNRVTGGLSSLSGAAIAATTVTPFAHASANEDPAPAPSMLLNRVQSADAPDGLVAQATDIAFRYRPEGAPVLDGCSLRIERGARFLLEGQSGSGKTTFASVLAGLNKPDSGLLLVDGLDRSVLGSTGWRKRVVMAPQAHDNYLVSGSLAFNLLMGREWPADAAALAEAESLCHELGLGDLLRRLPSGIHQVVGETGWQLSQGERVRVFLARALLQKPDLLILDESFSALDPENVVRSIQCVLTRARTVLAIAHT